VITKWDGKEFQEGNGLTMVGLSKDLLVDTRDSQSTEGGSLVIPKRNSMEAKGLTIASVGLLGIGKKA
jgi:hypothetical protein